MSPFYVFIIGLFGKFNDPASPAFSLEHDTEEMLSVKTVEHIVACFWLICASVKKIETEGRTREEKNFGS